MSEGVDLQLPMHLPRAQMQAEQDQVHETTRMKMTTYQEKMSKMNLQEMGETATLECETMMRRERKSKVLKEMEEKVIHRLLVRVYKLALVPIVYVRVSVSSI